MNVNPRQLRDLESLMKRLTEMPEGLAKKTAVLISTKLYSQIKEKNTGEVEVSFEMEVGSECASNIIETFSINNVSIALAAVTGQKRFPLYEVVFISEDKNKKRFGTVNRDNIQCFL